MIRSKLYRRLNQLLIYGLLAFGSVVFFVPFLWLVLTSLKPVEQTMTVPIQWLPRAYFVQVGNERWSVRRGETLADDGLIVRVIDGPRSGAQLIVPARDVADGRVTLEIQRSDRTNREPFACEVLKEVKKGWVRVIEKSGKTYTEEERWTAVPPGSLESRIEFQWVNYKKALAAIPFFVYLKNTLIVTFLSTLAMTISSAVVAYGFARISWPGRDWLFAVSIATMMVPGAVTMVPLYSVFKSFGMIGTLQPLWVPAFFAHAFNIFLLRQFFLTLPFDVTEAAKIDGCGEFRIFAEIILPLSKPALAVVALFNFMGCWNDFMGPLIYLNRPETFTLALGLQQFQSKSGGTEWHLLMAVSVLIILPIILLFFFTQKTFIQGLAATGSKE